MSLSCGTTEVVPFQNRFMRPLLELLAKEDGGLGVVIVAGTGLVSGGEIEADGGVEIVLGVEVQPPDSLAAGMIFGGLHEGVSEAESAKCGAHVEALDLGGMGGLRQGAEHDASGGRRPSCRRRKGYPDGRIGAGEVVHKGGAVVAQEDSDGLVIFLDESEGDV